MIESGIVVKESGPLIYEMEIVLDNQYRWIDDSLESLARKTAKSFLRSKMDLIGIP